MSDTADPYDLDRFVQAQEQCYAQALSEIRSGRKTSHWMWFIFPQYEGLGHSPQSRYYSIKSVAEAKTYLYHRLLGPRLKECAEAALAADAKGAEDIFGPVDAKKLRSCATLFAWVSPSDGSVFHALLEKYFAGEPDGATLSLLGVSRADWDRRVPAKGSAVRRSPSKKNKRVCRYKGGELSWKGPQAPVLSYFDDWRSAVFECPCCGWRGRFRNGVVEAFAGGFDSSCPVCTCPKSNCMIAVVMNPTAEECEVEANLDRLPPRERESIERWLDYRRRWEATSLKSPAQLPELEGDKLVLTWDLEKLEPDDYTVIRHGDVEVWRELAVYEGSDRFREIAELLQARYGDRVVDLVPTERSGFYLYGDEFNAITKVEEARELLRGGPGPLTSV